MSQTKSILSAVLLCSAVFDAVLTDVQAAERPTLNYARDPGDPRPDILPIPFYYVHTEYRRAYNRPRDIGGWIAHKIEPTSQEAMVWCENVQAGNYDRKHMPPMCKTYYYPKPWEALLTGARPDFQRTNSPAQPARPQARPVDPGDMPAGGEAVEGEAVDENSKEMSDSESKRVPPVPVPAAASVRYLPPFSYSGR
jgi:hypothetical protein